MEKFEKELQDNTAPHIVMDNTYSELADKCKQYVTCDTARISKPLVDGKMFLIIGFNRNTKEDKGWWVNQDGERIDFDYVQESIAASGHTENELIESAKEYQRICGITMEQYFQELAQKNCR